MPVHLVELPFDERDPLLRLAAVGLELGLTGTAQADATDSLPGEVRPHPSQPRQAVLELGKLDLQAPLMGLRAAGKDIEDQRGAVDDHDIELTLEVALLGGAKLAVDQDDVVAERLAQLLDLLQLAFADVGAGVRVSELLRDRADDLDIDRLGQPRQLLERVSRCPLLLLLFDSNKQRLLGRALGDDGFACDTACLSFSAVW